MKIKRVTVVVVLRLNDMVQHNIRHRRKKNLGLQLSFEWPCLLQTKQAMAKADLGVGPEAPSPPFVVYQIFQHYIFNMESRHLLNLSVQNVLDCTSENFNLENFPARACARNSIEKCIVRSPDGRYRARVRVL